MKASKFLGTVTTSLFGAILAAGLLSQRAAAQAPYLLPYTMQTLAGTGTAASNTAAGSACTGFPANTSYDAFGDGCPITSPSVVVGTGSDIHDVVVDQQGNVYFLDNGSNGVVRRIDARSGVITVYYGSLTAKTVCASSIDKYGDNCIANDGEANANGGFTASDSKARGLGIAANGDLYIASYSGNVIHKISLATGLTSIVAGFVTGTGKATLFTGVKGFTGDGAPAAAAEVNTPRGVTIDNAGNIYIADSGNNVVRKVTASTGIISTIAGSTTLAAGSTGDGGPASAAFLGAPEDVEADAAGDLFIADFANSKVRVIYQGGAVAARLITLTNGGTVPTVGDIYTIMGGGAGVYTPGTIVPATSVPVGGPRKIALDSRGNVYLADSTNDIVWFLDASTGDMRVLAGTYGATTPAALCATSTDAVNDGCPATVASLSPSSSMGVSVDAFGQLYITDTGDFRLRKVYTNQAFAPTAVGAPLSQILEVHYAAGDAPAATNPYTITGSPDFTITASTCTVNSDTTQDCLVTVTYKPSFAGREAASLTLASRLNGASVAGLTGSGIAATVAIDPGAVSSFATAFNNPFGIAQDNAGNTYVADTGNNRVLRFAPAGGTPVIIAGTGTAGFTGDGALPAAATLNAPKSVAVARNGAIYIADSGNNAIRRIDPISGLIATVAGGKATPCAAATDALGDGCPGAAATLSNPSGLAADADGNVYIADTGNNVVRELSFSGYLSLVAGAGTPCAATATNGVDALGNNCLPTQTIFSAPTALVVDAARNLFIADTGNNEVRELVSTANIVARVAGNGQAGASGNGGTASIALLAAPTGVGTDAAGNVYIADTGNAAIRVVSGGVINTIVGALGTPGTGALPASAAAVQLTTPQAVFSNGAGRLIVLDSGNNRALTDDRGSVTFNFGRTNVGTSSPTLQIQETSTGAADATLSPANTSIITNTGDTASFSLLPLGSTGCNAGQTLAAGANCLLIAQFTPIALGPVTATYTESATNTINNPAPFITLAGTGATLTPTSSATVINGSPSFAVPFTVTTTVTPQSCNTAAPSCVPTGTVTFFADGNQQGVPIPLSATGNATQTITGLTVGTHTITAVYSGDDFYASSTAPGVNAIIAKGPTRTTVSASAQTSPQFSPLTLTASVTGPTANAPTGTVSFFNAGTQLLGAGALSAVNGAGTASTSDITLFDSGGNVIHTPQSFNLPAGTYSITAVYSGDANYTASTSAPYTLVIAPDAATFTAQLQLVSGTQASTAGTAQGSTANLNLVVTAANTINGALTFACTGLPTYSVCTFSPTTLTFTPVAGPAITQTTQVTLWTDVPPGVDPTKAMLSTPQRPYRGVHSFGETTARNPALATLLGWPVLLSSLFGIFAFRKRLRATRLLAMLALFGLLAGGSAVLSGCSVGGGKPTPDLTPTGSYSVNVIVTGPNGATFTAPVTFSVGTGIPGQE